MKSIEQNVGIVFSAIEIQDAIIVAPLMDELIDSININRRFDKYQSLNEEEKKMYRRPDSYNRTFCNFNSTNVYNIYKTLTAHGYCGSGSIDLLPDGYPLIRKE